MLENNYTLPNGLVVPNRLVKASTTEALATETADVSEKLVALYERWGGSGVGLVLSGNVGIDPAHLVRPGDVLVSKGSDKEALRRLAAATKRGGAKAFVQICHAGRQTQRWLNPNPVAPSAVRAVKILKAFGEPREATHDEIARIREAFVQAALIGEEAGFDGCQLHAAHGYLLNQFLSPSCNVRTDAYGGGVENRARLLVEIIREVKARRRSPLYAISVKLNSADFQRGGFTEEDSLAVIGMLEAEGIDLLEISGGNYESPAQFGEKGVREATAKREAYFLEFTRKARAVTQVPLLLTGGFRSRAAMEDALAEGALDFIGLARPFCAEPELGKRLLADPAARIELRTRWPLGRIGSFLEMAWYSEQIQRMGRRKDVDLSMSPLLAGIRHYLRDRRAAARGRKQAAVRLQLATSA